MANLVVCCDGTWNTPDDTDKGLPAPTNVFKFYGAIADADPHGDEQAKYYHPGVGSSGNVLERLAGGGLGVGLDQNIQSAYKWLGVNFSAGDKIMLFGFSRGAYTVRSLAGMIAACGLLDLSNPNLADDTVWERVKKVYASYRLTKNKRTPLTGMNFHGVKAGEAGAGKVGVHFLGVWDTVGALGIPDDLGVLNLLDNLSDHSFHDTELSGLVSHARHAVAVDERRASFTPTFWTKISSKTDAKQIWFSGVHGDVGGGYLESGLSDIALRWMMDEAESCGLTIRDGVRSQLRENVHGILHDSVAGVFKGLKTRPRSVPNFLDTGSAFHQLTFARQGNPPLAQPDYWPSVYLKKGELKAVDVFSLQKWNATGIYLDAGRQYRFSAKGQWIDGESVKCGPDGAKDGKFQLGEIAHIGASAIGELEQLFRWITDNKKADFWLSKREEKMPWFSLVGVIAGGNGAGRDGNAVDHETLLIGKGQDSYEPKMSGYLYCFANDAWQAYGNNKGSVRLTVECLS